MISVKVDLKSLHEALGSKARTVVRQAVVRTINRAMDQANTAARREISEKLGVKQKDLKTRITVIRATSKNPTAELLIANKKVPLVAFSPRPVKVMSARGPRIGVSVVIDGVRQIVKGAFLTDMRSGKRGVFERKGRKRLPIRQMFAAEISKLINMNVLTDKLRKVVVDSVNKNLQANLSYYFERAKK